MLESHIFGLTHTEKTTAIAALCHRLKNAIIGKDYCHNTAMYQAMVKGLLAAGCSSILPFQMSRAQLKTIDNVQKERTFLRIQL